LPDGSELPRLPYVEITTSPENAGSQKVIRANVGVLVEEFDKLASLGGGRDPAVPDRALVEMLPA